MHMEVWPNRYHRLVCAGKSYGSVMGMNGAEGEAQGYVLLMAATPPGKRPVVDATEAVPQLAAVQPAVLLGTSSGSVVQVTDPGDPNAVLAHLRTAAANPGPLLIYLAGQLQLDSRQRMPHVALTKSYSPKTVRYTGLPWQWLVAELAHRPPDHTAILVDLVADTGFWEHREDHQLDAERTVFGVIAPPPQKRRTASPAYSRALAALLRGSPVRPPLDQLHRRAAAQAGLTGERELLLGGQPEAVTTAPAPLLPTGVPPMPAVPPKAPALHWGRPGGRHEAVFSAAGAGRHAEAMAIAATAEEAALRAGGMLSDEAIHWAEVRADLARLAGDLVRSCQLWLQVASVRLQAGQSPTAPELVAAVDRAHHCWHTVTAPTDAVQLGTELLSLRTRVTGKAGAREDVQKRLSMLTNAARQ